MNRNNTTRNLTAACLLLAALTTHAATNEVKVQYISTPETIDYVIPDCVLVVNRDNPEELRIGDGITPGGHRIQNSAALTNIAYSFYDDLHANGHRIYLNNQSYLLAEGQVTRMYLDNTPIWSFYAESNSVAGQISRTELISNNTLRAWVNVSGDLSQPIQVDCMPNPPTGTWETCTTATFNWPPQTDPFPVDIPLPDTADSGFYRITFPLSATGMIMSVNASLYAPHIRTPDLQILGGSGLHVGTNSFIVDIAGNVTDCGSITAAGTISAPSLHTATWHYYGPATNATGAWRQGIRDNLFAVQTLTPTGWADAVLFTPPQ